jgi:hypothetical protein
MNPEGWLSLLALWPGARWLQASGTAYLLVNAAHILGLGLLVGAALPLDLRLAGCFRTVPLLPVAGLLVRTAAFGLALALLTGAWLFTVQPDTYVQNPAFLWKMGLLLLALLNVAGQHLSTGWACVQAGASPPAGVRARAVASLLLWVVVLVAGRWIGFL